MLSTPPSAAASAPLVSRSRLTCRSRCVKVAQAAARVKSDSLRFRWNAKGAQHLRPKRLDRAELGHFDEEILADAQRQVQLAGDELGSRDRVRLNARR